MLNVQEAAPTQHGFPASDTTWQTFRQKLQNMLYYLSHPGGVFEAVSICGEEDDPAAGFGRRRTRAAGIRRTVNTLALR